jgi:hypothetical protein
MRTTPISGEGVFSLPFMAGFAYVTAAIPRFVSLEMVETLRPTIRQRSVIAVMRIKAVVDMAEKTVRAVKPGASSEEHSAHEPIGPIIAVRSTVIWGIVEVSIRAYGSRSDVYPDDNLRSHHRHTA